jgi:hypothetical protein
MVSTWSMVYSKERIRGIVPPPPLSLSLSLSLTPSTHMHPRVCDTINKFINTKKNANNFGITSYHSHCRYLKIAANCKAFAVYSKSIPLLVAAVDNSNF